MIGDLGGEGGGRGGMRGLAKVGLWGFGLEVKEGEESIGEVRVEDGPSVGGLETGASGVELSDVVGPKRDGVKIGRAVCVGGEEWRLE